MPRETYIRRILVFWADNQCIKSRAMMGFKLSQSKLGLIQRSSCIIISQMQLRTCKRNIREEYNTFSNISSNISFLCRLFYCDSWSQQNCAINIIIRLQFDKAMYINMPDKSDKIYVVNKEMETQHYHKHFQSHQCWI